MDLPVNTWNSAGREEPYQFLIYKMETMVYHMGGKRVKTLTHRRNTKKVSKILVLLTKTPNLPMPNLKYTPSSSIKHCLTAQQTELEFLNWKFSCKATHRCTKTFSP